MTDITIDTETPLAVDVIIKFRLHPLSQSHMKVQIKSKTRKEYLKEKPLLFPNYIPFSKS
jgi:hypothetical protein